MIVVEGVQFFFAGGARGVSADVEAVGAGVTEVGGGEGEHHVLSCGGGAAYSALGDSIYCGVY